MSKGVGMITACHTGGSSIQESTREQTSVPGE
jgi:hypothetical protein